MTDQEKLRALALCLKAIDDCYEELAEFKANIKARVETLLKESHALRDEVLSGQERLPLEGTCVMPAVSNAALMTECHDADATGAQTPTAGTMTQTNSATSTETRTTQSKSDETSTEERARERKKRKLRAILPDPRKPTDPPAPGVQP